jgi:apolipoprotein N-acyltransferase
VGEFGPVFLKRIRWEFSLSVLLIALVFSYGVRRLMDPPAMGTTVALDVAMIQANIPQTDKFDPEAEDAIFAQLKEQTALAAALRPNLIIWPESATPRGIFDDQTNFDFVTGLVAENRIPLLFGTVLEDPTVGSFNGAVLLSPDDIDPLRWPTYRKIHLVPFGEYLPLRPLLGWALADLLPGDFLPGDEHTLLPLAKPPIKIAALVCFEDTVGELTRRFANAGADVLVNVTNDGWFGHSAAARVHLVNAVFRAVENRRPLLRCCNTGITANILPTGRIDEMLPPFCTGILNRRLQVPVQAATTFYTRHGDWIAWFSAGVTLVAVAARLFYRPRM